MSAGPAAIRVDGLTKAYSGTTGVFDVTFEVRPGSLMALLGPNGAGKTTVIRVLATLLRPDQGRVEVAGIDALRRPREVQAAIGIANQSAAIDERLSGRANLMMFGRLHRLRWGEVRARTRELLVALDLEDAASKPSRTYSGGMRRKLDLAVSLIGRPAILFLDEPTTGLDPESRQAVWDLVRGLVAGGTTVLLTTQYLEEADALAGEVTFLEGGRVVARGTPAELKSRAGGRRLDLTLRAPEEAHALAAHLGMPGATSEGRQVHVGIGDRLADLQAVLDAVGRAGFEPAGYRIHAPSLDDVYFTLTGHARSAAGSDSEEPAA